MGKSLKTYEIGFLARNDDSGEEVVKTLAAYKAEIIEKGVISGLKLAYPIKKENFAYFGYIRFRFDTSVLDEKEEKNVLSAVKKINDELKMNPKIMRFMIIALPKKALEAKKERIFPKSGAGDTPVLFKPQPLVESGSISDLSNEALEKKLEEILK